MFDFSIVMVYNDTKKQTLQTLKRFEKLYAKKYSLQVIIVDNSNSDKLSPIIGDYKNIQDCHPVMPIEYFDKALQDLMETEIISRDG